MGVSLSLFCYSTMSMGDFKQFLESVLFIEAIMKSIVGELIKNILIRMMVHGPVLMLDARNTCMYITVVK